MENKMKFYTFFQNNPSGEWHYHMGYAVVIEAEDAEQANEKAEEIGIYFDGTKCGRDCPCFGDRWDRVDEHCAVELEGLEKRKEELKLYQKGFGMESYVRYNDGRVEEII